MARAACKQHDERRASSFPYQSQLRPLKRSVSSNGSQDRFSFDTDRLAPGQVARLQSWGREAVLTLGGGMLCTLRDVCSLQRAAARRNAHAVAFRDRRLSCAVLGSGLQRCAGLWHRGATVRTPAV